ncbi:MAG: hypothetical protein AAF334_03855, partial [Pseudomonadota bacterium]
MDDMSWIKGSVAAVLAFGLLSGSPLAQSNSGGDSATPSKPPETRPLPAPGEEEVPARDDAASDNESTKSDGVDRTRAAHLDQLFSRLAEEDNPDWQRVQGQIWAAWNQSGSDSMNLLARRADEAMEAKNYDLALQFLNDLVRLAPEFAEGWNKRATLYFIREDYGASLEDIAETLRREPRHFGALSGL